ncbi:MIB [Mytilus coruscus]|uniref:Poly [ADP-ribose] polymerase n=1 Tax=Mytilus coruscus TaxID=42192 RepID=A0A6J8DBU5_MYTCO|nr:MIB [Mytilus coruscus]
MSSANDEKNFKIKPGTRVVRGPDWISKKQDNGEGFLGTVIFVPKPGSDDKKVTVIWDSGRELRYRAGENGKYDLRVFDTAPSGVCHPNITCDICGEKESRMESMDCHDFDMCMDTPNTTAFNVPTRSKSASSKRTAKGIFPNAEVMRGPHWKWKNDDGGEGGVGLVKTLETWGKDSYRGAVKILWKADNLVKNYRVGGEGCVDVIYTRMTETASGGNYYADHLPFVDVVNPGQILLKIGDKVIVTLPLKGFRQLQDNQAYGGWDDEMNQCLDETGTIVGFLYSGMSVKVQYEDSKTWVINKVALTRKHTFNQGDAVTILNNYNAVKELQKGHGGWNDEMKTALGKNGRIVRLDSDGDMRIKIEDKTWIFNPACIMPIDDDSTAKSIPVLSRQDTRDHSDDESETGSEGDEGGQAVAEAIAQLFVAMLREAPGTEEENDSIVEAAAKGDFDVVKRIVKKHPDKINTKMEGKTALQLACYEGHHNIVEFLVKNKADVNIKDSEGDTALHYAAYGKESKILQVLLDNKATVNAVNAKKQSALHIAVNKGQPNCCKVLVNKGCDPNLKVRGQPYCCKVLVNKGCDPNLKVRGQPNYCKVLVDKGCDPNLKVRGQHNCSKVLVDKGCDPNLEVRGQPYCCKVLVDKGCDPNLQGKRSTLSVLEVRGQPNCSKVLVDKGCDPNLEVRGQPYCCKVLVDKGCDPNLEVRGQPYCSKVLVDKGCDPNLEVRGQPYCCKVLVDKGCDPNLEVRGQPNCSKVLVDKGCDPNLEVRGQPYCCKVLVDKGCNPNLKVRGQPYCCKVLVDKGCNPNLKVRGQPYCCKVFVDKGCDPNLKVRGQPLCSKVLVDKGCDPNLKVRCQPYCCKVFVDKGCDPNLKVRGEPNCCKVLVDKGRDPNLKDDDLDTAMHDAISQKDAPNDILKYVLGSKTAKFATENSRGFNVLHWAVLKDNKDSVEIIISNDKTCVDSKMKDGSTAMHIAAANDRVEIASILQSKGAANMNIRDSMKRTPLILAVSQGKKKTMELLITVGCDINAQDSSGNTALHVAQVKKNLGQAVAIDKAGSSSQDTAIICLLIESGAHLDIKNEEGKTPLDFANDDMVREFMKTLAKRAKKKDFATTAKGIPAPSNWSDMRGETVSKVSIGPTKGGIMQIEFDNVKQKFEKTLPQARIISIHRMQNMFLWEMYYLKKRKLEHAYGNGCANELTLFHGTTPDKLDVIAEQNLDPRLAGGRVGALFGKGTYFATDAKYSDLYSQADQNGHKFMFLVKVLAGKTCIGRPEYVRPPSQDHKNPNSPIFDSCVDNEKTPRIYCIFHDTQYYPEHLIEYT